MLSQLREIFIPAGCPIFHKEHSFDSDNFTTLLLQLFTDQIAGLGSGKAGHKSWSFWNEVSHSFGLQFSTNTRRTMGNWKFIKSLTFTCLVLVVLDDPIMTTRFKPSDNYTRVGWFHRTHWSLSTGLRCARADSRRCHPLGPGSTADAPSGWQS